ncbi:hypothetical protein HaLaN_28228 [Haematococcus lacustris]|uniref:Uncharacterized protein n=1 Tax=Haematococcus lacustris TaxID=44745 RepID=A0A6A0ACI3_HAELA|nr:hypothetical protein HaLaN_28228 [Haematococcus lacustris]
MLVFMLNMRSGSSNIEHYPSR